MHMAQQHLDSTVEAATRCPHKRAFARSLFGRSKLSENGLAIPFVTRLISMFAPTVREIAKRSPNEFELTLKTEAEGGRREELYLRKEALVSTLQPLPAKGREVFAPLGLDKWVPSMTAAPPAVQVAPQPPQPPPPPVSQRTEPDVPRLNLASDPPQHPAVPPIPSAPPSKK